LISAPDPPSKQLPVLPVGPPPVGLVISSLLSWDEFSRVYPGIDRFWLPADGRPMPEGCTLARILAARGDAAPFSLPDLRGATLRGATQFATRVIDGTLRDLVTAAAGTGVPTQPVYFYVRYD
jgi:hypothetical protein